MTTASLKPNPYGLPEALSQAISKLSQPEVNLEETCKDILEIAKAELPITEEVPIKNSIPFLYDAGELRGKCPLAITYTIKRLLRGLASVTPHTKLAYASALLVVFKEYAKSLPSSILYQWLLLLLERSNAFGSGRMNKTEGIALLSGRLIGIDVIISCLPIDDVAVEILNNMIGIWLEQDSLCSLSQSVIVKLLNSVSHQVKDKCIKIIQSLLSTNNNIEAPKLVALAMAIRYHCSVPEFGMSLDEIAHDLLLPVFFMPLISSINVNNLGFPHVHVFFSTLLSLLLSQGRDYEFVECWGEVSQLLLQRAEIGGTFLKQLLVEFFKNTLVSEKVKEALLNPWVVQFLVNDKTLPTFSISDLVVKCPSLSAHIIQSLVGTEGGDGLDLSRDIILTMDLDKLKGTLGFLKEFKASKRETLRLLDLHLSLLKADSTILNLPGASQIILESMISTVIMEEIPDETFLMRLQSGITRIICSATRKNLVCHDEIIMDCVNLIDQTFNLSTPNGKARFNKLDEPVQDAWKSALSLTPRIKKRLTQVNEDKKSLVIIKALDSVCLTGRLMLFLDPTSSVSIFDDLKGCLKRVSKDDYDQTGTHPVDVLIDILLQWLSRPSTLLRRISDDTFKCLVPHITEKSYESILEIIKTSPGSEEDLMDNDEIFDDSPEDEGEEEEEEEEEEDDPPAKKNKTIIIRRPNYNQKKDANDSESESDIVDLDEADSGELEAFDAKLSEIMHIRKKNYNSKNLAREALVHFKQRILDWILIIFKKTLEDQQLFIIKVKAAPVLLEALRLHSVHKERQSGGNAANDRDFISKVSSIMTDFYAKNVKSNVQLSKKEMDFCQTVTDDLLKDIQVGVTDYLLLSHTFSAFWFVSRGEKSSEDAIAKALYPIWISFLKVGDKKHSVSFLSFFERLRSKFPRLILRFTSTPESTSILANLRPYTRVKLLSFVEPTLKKSSLQSDLVLQAGKDCLQSLARLYNDAVCLPEGFLRKMNFSQLREELGILNSIVSKSRLFFNPGALAEWNPLLIALIEYFTSLKSQMQANQIDSLTGRVKSMLALLQMSEK